MTMKHLLRLLSIITFFSTNVLAQSYIPIPDHNAVWVQGAGLYHAYPNHPIATCDSPLSFGTDTIINAITYHRLYGQRVCNWLNTYVFPPPAGTIVSGTDYYPVSLQVIFRQDTAQKKVYLYDMFSHKDTLLYDFGNLVVGQPYPATFTAPSYLNLSVSSQYTIALGGNTHRVWKVGTVTEPNVVDIIEGVGSTQGFNSQILIPFESMNYLHCFSKAGNVLFSNWPGQFNSLGFPSKGTCDITLNMAQLEKESGKPFLFPNPADKVVHLQSPTPIISYRVLDLSSRELLAEQFSASNSIDIDLTTLNFGSYLIVVRDKPGFETTLFVIKQ